MRAAALAVRFALEIGALVALGYWGFKTGDSAVADIVLGIGAPLAGAVIWGLFVSPKAKYGSPTRQAAFEALVFGAATLALLHAGRTGLAIAFAAIAAADSVLVRVVDA
jgi:Protein of unknown function (DUF2568)